MTQLTPSQQQKHRVGIEAIRGAFTLLILTVWLLFGSLLFFCIYTLFTPAHFIENLVSSIILLLCGWAFFPRLDTPPPEIMCITEAEFPALYHMVVQIAELLGVPMPNLVLTHQYTAGFGRFGFQHVPVLFLGHGLLSLTNRQETVLLLAHELYHVHHSGWGQTRPAKITIGGIKRLIKLLSLQSFRKTRGIPRGLQLPLAPLMLLMHSLRWCMAYEMRHIETCADEAALALSSCNTMETLLQKTAFRHVQPVQQAYMYADPSQKYSAIRAAADQIDPVRFARLWRGMIEAKPHMFDRHPSIIQRIAAAQQLEDQQRPPVLSLELYTSAHQELEQWPVWLDNLEKTLTSYLD